MSRNDFKAFVADVRERFDEDQPEKDIRADEELGAFEMWLLQQYYYESRVVENLINEQGDF